ncbi:cell division protein FtsQ/DivIB [Demequina lutea]|uniref:Cell division protein FtsQ n=1 Tax=Demequina lutea TaxID=431489 RepID=A0A7Z0CKD8_9MICO|nr:FtsQ-type POTRA domain-containing protein [Demequina lutea]NYI41762.1 cell division protein FtsQ [Demequina lutea]
MSERLAERKRTERRRALARFGRWAAVVAVAAGALWAFFMSPLFALDPAKVELSGMSNEIDATAVTGVLASHDGESLALLNVPHVADQLRDIKGVLDAKVERVWPAGLRVTLVARHPVAAIASGTGFALLDADAIQVGLADQAPADLPLVTVPVGDNRVLAAVLEVIRNLPADLLGKVSGIGAQTEDTVSFDLKGGPHVEWGSSGDSALKAQVLEVMLASPSAATAGVIDVSAPTLPITRAAG